ncbi:hypothetical protein [Streptomyces californicus]|uniref:hypothetical protein n=1 Tax=Streptomyces californicus TaxID=67351 RepID=UPI0037AD8802
MNRSPLVRTQRRTARVAALVTGIAAALALTTGTASATTPAGPPPAVVDDVTRLICTELEDVLGQLPPHSAPVQVCKLVNGWD